MSRTRAEKQALGIPTGRSNPARAEYQAQQESKRRRGPIYGTPTNDTDAAEVLLNEIRRTAGHIEWLRLQLSDSDPEMFVKTLWLTKRASGFVTSKEIDTSDWSKAGALWVELYLNERRHLASICRTALAAGIEERRVRLAEKQAERVGEAIRGILLDIGALYDIEVDLDDDRVRSIVYRWLMQSAGVTTTAEPVHTTLAIDP